MLSWLDVDEKSRYNQVSGASVTIFMLFISGKRHRAESGNAVLGVNKGESAHEDKGYSC